MAAAPSGEQFELRLGNQSVTAVEVGGGLRSYRVGDWEVLDGYGLDEMCSSGRGQLLVPWPNRIDRGRYEFAGQSFQLAITEPPQNNAIHGLTRWSAWSPVERSAHRLALETVLHAQPGYPFTLRVRAAYHLSEAGLAVTTTATNLGSEPCPYGSGAHPYIKVGDGVIDDAVLEARLGSWYESNDRQIPTRRAPVARSPFDFGRGRPVGSTVIDTAFTDLGRDEDGLARVSLSSPGRERTVRLWLDENHPYLMLFTGDTLPEAGRRRRGLGVEPMTCAPNAFASGDGLRVLEPGESFGASWGLEVAQQA